MCFGVFDTLIVMFGFFAAISFYLYLNTYSAGASILRKAIPYKLTLESLLSSNGGYSDTKEWVRKTAHKRACVLNRLPGIYL